MADETCSMCAHRNHGDEHCPECIEKTVGDRVPEAWESEYTRGFSAGMRHAVSQVKREADLILQVAQHPDCSHSAALLEIVARLHSAMGRLPA